MDQMTNSNAEADVDREVATRRRRGWLVVAITLLCAVLLGSLWMNWRQERRLASMDVVELPSGYFRAAVDSLTAPSLSKTMRETSAAVFIGMVGQAISDETGALSAHHVNSLLVSEDSFAFQVTATDFDGAVQVSSHDKQLDIQFILKSYQILRAHGVDYPQPVRGRDKALQTAFAEIHAIIPADIRAHGIG